MIASAGQDSADISAQQSADFRTDVIIIAGSEGRRCRARQELLHSPSSSATLMTDAAFRCRPAGHFSLPHLFSVKRLASVLRSVNQSTSNTTVPQALLGLFALQEHLELQELWQLSFQGTFLPPVGERYGQAGTG